MSAVSLGTRPRYSLVVDDDAKKQTNQPNKQTSSEVSDLEREGKVKVGEERREEGTKSGRK